MEGSRCFGATVCSSAGITSSIAEYDHGEGDCTVSGGFVYRGKRFPGLRGIYYYGDFCSGIIRGLQPTENGWEGAVLDRTPLSISSFGEDEAGELYVADYGTGSITQLLVCTGDCNDDGTISVDEVLTAVNIALGNVAASACPLADINGDQQILVDELLAAINNLLNGCR